MYVCVCVCDQFLERVGINHPCMNIHRGPLNRIVCMFFICKFKNEIHSLTLFSFFLSPLYLFPILSPFSLSPSPLFHPPPFSPSSSPSPSPLPSLLVNRLQVIDKLEGTVRVEGFAMFDDAAVDDLVPWTPLKTGEHLQHSIYPH